MVSLSQLSEVVTGMLTLLVAIVPVFLICFSTSFSQLALDYNLEAVNFSLILAILALAFAYWHERVL